MRSVYESPKSPEGKKKRRPRSGSGLCETGKSFDSADLHLNGKKTL